LPARLASSPGASLPPAGVGLYIACAIIGIRMERVLPYLLVLVIALPIVAFVPWFTVFLLRALDLGG
jgi:TRAP-type C4-dicarboxylate transport system permease large subunit